jgi:3-hydroxyisobutyrate dehydrogenase-like beta-hydroxyacid dehydrogenase
MRVGFCGLGQMGGPMAARLVAAGHQVTVWNRTAGRASGLVAAGAVAAETPAAVAAASKVVITMLSTPAVLDDVLFGAGGVAEGCDGSQLIVEMSTVGPDAVRRAAAGLAGRARVVDAPVRGSVPAATEGTLGIMAGGSAADVAEAAEVLRELGTVDHVGPLGAGATLKLANNTISIGLTALVAEAFAIATASGVDERTALDVLEVGFAAPLVKRIRPLVEARRFDPDFKLSLAIKDIDLALAQAAEVGVPAVASAAVRDVLADAERAGAGDQDFSAVVGHLAGAHVAPS